MKTVSTPLDPIFGTSGSETGGAHRKGYSITSVGTETCAVHPIGHMRSSCTTVWSVNSLLHSGHTEAGQCVCHTCVLGEPSASSASRPAVLTVAMPGAERSQLVATHLVVVTSPPDARYSPLLAPRAASPRTFQGVRALVLPIADAQTISEVILLQELT